MVDILNVTRAKFAIVFPGQGSQYVGMGQQLYAISPAAQHIFQRADAVLGFPLSTLCFEGPQEELDDTVNAQPAILTVSIAYLEALNERFRLSGRALAPVLVAGHSMGEFTALVAARVLDFEDALKLVRERGRLMKESSIQRPGGMAAVVGLTQDILREICAEAQAHAAGIVTMANDNSPGQSVLSGELNALMHAMELAKARGARMVQRLAISIASHSPLMQQAAQSFGETLQNFNLRPPEIPLLSNITAQVLTSADELRQELTDHLTLPVQWNRSVQTAVGQGIDTFIEVGPSQVLSGLIRRISRNVQSISLSEMEILKIVGMAEELPHDEDTELPSEARP